MCLLEYMIGLMIGDYNMSKFNPGDKVKLVLHQHGLIKDNIYSVKSCYGHWLILEEDPVELYPVIAFELECSADPGNPPAATDTVAGNNTTTSTSGWSSYSPSPFAVSTGLRAHQEKIEQAMQEALLFGSGSFKIEREGNIPHDCKDNLQHYNGFTNCYQYCTVCDKKFGMQK